MKRKKRSISDKVGCVKRTSSLDMAFLRVCAQAAVLKEMCQGHPLAVALTDLGRELDLAALRAERASRKEKP